MHQENLRDRPPRVPTLGLSSGRRQVQSTDANHPPSHKASEHRSSFAQGFGAQVSFIQDEYSIKDIMKAQGIPDFFIRRSLGVVGQAPPPIPRFIDTALAIDEIPSYDSFEPSPDDF